MHIYSAWNLDASQISRRTKLATVIADLKGRSRLPNVRMNLAVVRLACCCGLRASEIGGLALRDAGRRGDLTAWKRFREEHGARAADPFVCSLQRATYGASLKRHVLRRRFHNACRDLGRDRFRGLTIHHGRHTFISHTSHAGGRTLAEVRAAAGHPNLVTTSLYLHIAVEDAGEPGDLFGYGRFEEKGGPIGSQKAGDKSPMELG